MKNRLIMIKVCEKTGLLNDPCCEHTDKPVTQVALVPGRGKFVVARIVEAKAVDGKLSGRVWDYLTDSEARLCRVAHAVRTADLNTQTGRMVAHVAANVRSWLRNRDINIQGIQMQHQVSEGWWIRACSGNKFWSELGSLFRSLEKSTLTPEGSIESPYYDTVGADDL